jgi:lipopolysaccharide export system protein LptA
MSLRRASACLLVVVLPLRGMAADASTAAPAAVATVPGAPATPLVDTVIESGAMEMVSTDKDSTFTFTNGVKVTATNMTLTCDFLEVIARRSGDPKATLGKQDNFKSLIATGNVRIIQNDREAVCERAEVFPGDDKVVLTGNPKVRSTDGQYEASGPRMELLRGERRARIIGEAGVRPRITLPPLKDLGYENEKEKEKKPAPVPDPAGTPPAATPPPITVPLTPAPR